MPVKTHTFRAGRYRIFEDAPLDGICDMPGDDNLGISIRPENTRKALIVAIHEAMHAERVPDALLHGLGGDSATRIGSFLWRLGWRRKAKGRA